MKTILEFKELRVKALADAKAILAAPTGDDGDLTDEQRTQFDALTAQADAHTADIERLEKVASITAVANVPQARQTTPDPPGGDDGLEVRDGRIALSIPHRRLKTFTGTNGPRDAYRFGMFARAAILPMDGDMADMAIEARAWCKEHGYNMRAQQTGTTNAGGGYSIPPEFSNMFIDLVEEDGIARQWCAVWPMQSDTMFVPRNQTGLTTYFINDTEAITASAGTGDLVQLSAKKLGALGLIPNDLIRDSVINWGDWFVRKAAQAFASKEDDCLLNGTGSAAFGGIVGIRTKMVDGNHAASYTDAVAGNDQFGEYDIGDFLVARPRPLMSAGYTPSWYCSRQGSMLDMDRLSFAQGGSNGQELRTGFGNVFIGDPVQLSQKMPIVTTALNELVAFLYGDMKQAVAFGSRDVFTIGQTSERYFEYDQTGFRATERFDINVHDIGDGSSAGPLVGIRGNTS